jgi:hypothetical protein
MYKLTAPCAAAAVAKAAVIAVPRPVRRAGMNFHRDQHAPAVRHGDARDGDDPAVAAEAGERLERSRHQQLRRDRRHMLRSVVVVVQPCLGALGMQVHPCTQLRPRHRDRRNSHHHRRISPESPAMLAEETVGVTVARPARG